MHSTTVPLFAFLSLSIAAGASAQDQKKPDKPGVIRPGIITPGKLDGQSPRRASRTQALDAVTRARAWLVAHQHESGRWEAAGFDQRCPTQSACDGAGNPLNDIGVTGLATLALLSAGPKARTGTYADSVKRAVEWLVGQADPSGLIGTSTGIAYQYNHAIATYALVEALVAHDLQHLRPAVVKAVRYITKAQNPYRVWRYTPRAGDNDTSITGWMALALTAAKKNQYEVPANSLSWVAKWFDSVTDDNGRCGYSRRGEPSSRPMNEAGAFPATQTAALTAIAVVCRLRLGQTPKAVPAIKQGAEVIADLLPTKKPERRDFCFWFFGSVAVAKVGGETQTKWEKATQQVLQELQETKGHAKGSWAPSGVWGSYGGRVYATALGALSLATALRRNALVE